MMAPIKTIYYKITHNKKLFDVEKSEESHFGLGKLFEMVH